MKLFSENVSSVICRKKSVTLDSKPYRMEVWGTSSLGGVVNASIPMYFSSFETQTDCEKARDLVLDFLSRYKSLKHQNPS